jgi:hypothetical protein
MMNDKIRELSKKYDIPESAVDESIVPLLLAMERNTEVCRELTQRVQASVHTHQHYYADTPPLTAFLVRWGRGVWVFVLTVFTALFFYILSENRKKLERLESVIQYRDSTDTYFIDRRFYKVVNTPERKGIEFTP